MQFRQQRSTAALELFAAATGAHLVPPRPFPPAACVVDQPLRAQAPGEQREAFVCVVEKLAVCTAKVIRFGRVSTAVPGTAARAAAVTQVEVVAAPALLGQLLLEALKSAVCRAAEDLVQRIAADIAQTVVGAQVEIARIGVAILLEDQRRRARPRVFARLRFATSEDAERMVKKTLRHRRCAVVVPKVETRAEKPAILLGGDQIARRHVRGLGAEVHPGNKLYVIEAFALVERPQLARLVHVALVQDCKDIEVDIVIAQVLDLAHYQIEAALAGGRDAVLIMNFARSIDAYADQEIVFSEEPRPLVRDESAVGLERVADGGAGRRVLRLQRDNLLEEFEAGEQRLAALPCETRGTPGERHVFADRFLKQRRVYLPAPRTRPPPAAAVVAIVTGEIAILRHRFPHHSQRAGRNWASRQNG